MSDDIFYRPQLEIPESFHTDGAMPHTVSIPPAAETQTQTSVTLTYLKDTCKKALKSLITLPVPIRQPIETGLFTVQFVLTLIPENKYENIKKPIAPENIHITEYTPHETETTHTKPFEDVLSNIFGAQKIEYVTKTDSERIDYKYYASICNIIEDYLDKVNCALAKYHTELVTQVGFDHLELAQRHYVADYNTIVETLGKDEGNISDLLVRQNALRNQKLRLLNKLCNERTSITHIKSCELSRLLLHRYYNIQKNNDYFHDVTLMQQIKDEESKLDKKIAQFYKYLNTSITLADECLALYAYEAIAKRYLQSQANTLDSDISLFLVVKNET